MVLDTRWKKFKYSNANKALCVIAACLMVCLMMMNAVKLISYASFFEGDIFKADKNDFYNSYVFDADIEFFVSRVFNSVNRNADEADYKAEEEKFISLAMAEYNKLAEQYRVSADEVYTDSDGNKFYVYDGWSLDDYLNEHDIYDEYYYDSYYLPYYWIEGAQEVYIGDDDNYYTKTFICDYDLDFKVSDDLSDGIDFGHTSQRAEELIQTVFYNNSNSVIYWDGDYYCEIPDSVKNIFYYAENTDGTVVSNVGSKDEIIKRINNGSCDYLVYEASGRSSSEKLSECLNRLNTFNAANREDCNVYIAINPSFSENDLFRDAYNEFLKTSEYNVNSIIGAILITFIAAVALAVVSVRLAGNTQYGLSASKLDKFPMDLHFAIMGAAVTGIAIGLILLIDVRHTSFFMSYRSYGDALSGFSGSRWYNAALMAGGVVVYLLITNFAVSLARAIKANISVIKHTFIFYVFYGIWKLLVLIFKGCKKSALKTKAFMESVKIKPEKLDKRAVLITILYTLFNIISFIGIALLLCAYESFLVFCGVLGIIALLGIDGFLILRAIRYMKALDDVISASEKREPLPYDSQKLPKSLKVLADSLETTNAELQAAILKAVKDERTKAELITNVSHDLKTPLTSVINYIDLLKKCDINDETANKYMEVIDEKSGKLKRLIEDLIEASKVTTGNVSINKVKLNLNELAAQAIVEETADFEKNNLSIIFEESNKKHIVFADGTKIYRVFENLLSNALKYSASGSRVYARLYSDEDYGYFELKNISKDQLNISAEELTERFVRGDKSRTQDGNGLGLSIAKELCRLNGGSLIIEIDGDLFKATVKLPKEEQ